MADETVSGTFDDVAALTAMAIFRRVEYQEYKIDGDKEPVHFPCDPIEIRLAIAILDYFSASMGVAFRS